MPKLLIKHPEKGDMTFTISGSRITVGRRAENGIQINHGTVSGVHAEIVASNGHYILRDLDSTNHCFVNGEQIKEAELKAACTVTFGTVECSFSPDEQKAVATASLAEVDTLRKNIGILRAQNDELLAKVAEQQKQIEIMGSAQIMMRPKADSEASSLKTKLEAVTAERDELAAKVKTLTEELVQLRASTQEDSVDSRKDTVRIKLLPTPGEPESALSVKSGAGAA
jgi:hypothetical protein